MGYIIDKDNFKGNIILVLDNNGIEEIDLIQFYYMTIASYPIADRYKNEIIYNVTDKFSNLFKVDLEIDKDHNILILALEQDDRKWKMV